MTSFVSWVSVRSARAGIAKARANVPKLARMIQRSRPRRVVIALGLGWKTTVRGAVWPCRGRVSSVGELFYMMRFLWVRSHYRRVAGRDEPRETSCAVLTRGSHPGDCRSSPHPR